MPTVNLEPCRTTGACISWFRFASISQPAFRSFFQPFFPNGKTGVRSAVKFLRKQALEFRLVKAKFD